jgi:NADH:ubiquinone oxidoreductase subunit
LERNHSLGIAEALYYTRQNRAVNQYLDEHFMGGMNVWKQMRAHLDYLELSEGIPEKRKAWLAVLTTPRPRTVSFWYDQWRQKHLGTTEGKSACAVGTATVLSEQ